jgi:hypothetical protein
MDDFADVGKKSWDMECPSSDPMEIWQIKIRLLRKRIRGWNRNKESEVKKSKINLLSKLDRLDLLSKHHVLFDQEREREREREERR